MTHDSTRTPRHVRLTDPFTLYGARVRFRILPRWVRRTSAALAMLVGPVALYFVVLRSSDRVSAEAASILVAVVAGLVATAQNRRQERRQTTVEVVANLQTSDRLAVADTHVARMIATERRIDPDLAARDDEHVIMLFDYYELLCALALRNEIDPVLLQHLRGSAMANARDAAHDYIHGRRETFGPTLYMAWEEFTRRHAATSP